MVTRSLFFIAECYNRTVSEPVESKELLCLNIDRFSAMHIAEMRDEVYCRIGIAKFAVGSLVNKIARRMRFDAVHSRARVCLDANLASSAVQAASDVADIEHEGFNIFTISGGADLSAITTAVQAASKASVVVSISREDPAEAERQIEKIYSANELLDPEHQITNLIVESSMLSTVRPLAPRPDWNILLTGVWLPGMPMPDDRFRYYPAEGLEAGADQISIGKAAFNAPMGLVPALDLVLANIS
jgi:hypothetical protein